MRASGVATLCGQAFEASGQMDGVLSQDHCGPDRLWTRDTDVAETMNVFLVGRLRRRVWSLNSWFWLCLETPTKE